MKTYVLDTHILWWYLVGNERKLSVSARRAFSEGNEGKALLYIPILVLMELWDVNQKHGSPFDFQTIWREIQQSVQYVIVSLDEEDVLSYDELRTIPNSRDRLIATAAKKMSAPLITADQQIIASGAIEVIE